jgi:hypothetical protein
MTPIGVARVLKFVEEREGPLFHDIVSRARELQLHVSLRARPPT